LSRQITDVQKDHNEGLSLIQDTLGDHKRKNLQAVEEVFTTPSIILLFISPCSISLTLKLNTKLSR